MHKDFIQKITTNRKASFNFEIIKEFEAGICLLGCEVKSILENKIDIQNSYCIFKNNEIFLKDCIIQEYKQRYKLSCYDSTRERKILIKKSEIKKLKEYYDCNNGISIIPIEVYRKGSLIKFKLSLCKGKTLFDKRSSIKLSDSNKQIRSFKQGEK
jgi:SsrA-binding protein